MPENESMTVSITNDSAYRYRKTNTEILQMTLAYV